MNEIFMYKKVFRFVLIFKKLVIGRGCSWDGTTIVTFPPSFDPGKATT